MLAANWGEAKMQTVRSNILPLDGKRSKPLFSLGYAALEPLAALSEALVLVLAGFLAVEIYNLAFDLPLGEANSVSWGVVVIATLTYVTLSYLTGGYKPRLRGGRRSSVMAGLRIWGAALSFLALCAFMLKVGGDFSRATLLIYAALGAVSIGSLRAAWPSFVRRAVDHNLVFVTNVIVLRARGAADTEAGIPPERLQELRVSGLRPVAWGTVSMAHDDGEFSSIVELVHEQLRAGRAQQIIILSDWASLADLNGIVDRLRIFPLPVRVVLDKVTRDITRRRMTKAGSLVLAEWQRAPLSDSERALKRALDVSVATVGLLLLSPLFVMTALLIKLDSPGPVLFRQSRRGFGGKTFAILKFRSMTVADNGAHVVQAKKDDARITRVGKWIRRTSVDELPQLWNVLRGDMSIVGPRPHAVAHDDYYSRFIDEYAFRHHAKPGLTGWAQVKGLRGETPKIENMQARIENDIWYIDNWSIWLDISIIARTAFVVLGQKTAY